ncbi:MAG TPA: ABC transporter permease [Thermoanaerobaculia bacterium]|nr:ABC transporter permease [Thermoanaerobaculia bacterium]
MLSIVRRALAGLRRERALSAVIVVTLALALAGVAVQVRVVDRLFLRPLPAVTDADQLDRIHATFVDRPERRSRLTWADWQDLRSELGGLYLGAAATSSFPASLIAGGEPRRVDVAAVDGAWFGLLGANARLGTAIDPGNADQPIAVVSHALWRSELGGGPLALGHTIRLNGHPFTVIGVAAPEFRGTAVLDGADLWIPLEQFERTAAGISASFHGQRDRKQTWIDVVARRAPGVDPSAIAARLEVLGRRLDALPEHGHGYRLVAHPVIGGAGQARSALARWIGLFGAVVLLVLVAACSNVAGLLAGRTLRRHRELGVRLALGESRGLLAGSLLLEGVVLALLGGLLGLLLLAIVGRLAGEGLVFRGVPLQPGIPAILATLAVAVASSVAFGLLPALAAARPGPTRLLGERLGGGRRWGAREVLVVVQVAICFLVLVGAALTGRTLRELRRTPLGFDPDRLLAASIDVAERGWGSAEVQGFYERLRERLETSPAIDRAGLAAALPMVGSEMVVSLSVEILDRPPPAEGEPAPGAAHALADAGLLRVLGLPLVAGRGFGPQDTASAPLVALVNEAAARTHWPEGAVGRQVRLLQTEEPVEIVGVVADARLHELEEEPAPLLLLPHAQAGRSFLGGILQPSTTVVARASGSTDAALVEVRRAVRELAPEIPLFDVTTLDARLARLVRTERQATLLFVASSGIALALSLLGLFAIAAQSVVERARELGIRTACGATPRDQRRLVLRRTALLTLCGVGLGVIAASPLGRLIEGQLHGASATAPAIWTLAGLIVLTLACAVAWVPARRAARVDPVRALRRE